MNKNSIITIAINKKNIINEIDFKNSNAFFYLMSNLSQEERRSPENSDAFKNIKAIINSIDISSRIKDDEYYIVTESLNLREYNSRTSVIAAHSFLIYLDEKNSKENKPLNKTIYRSIKKSLNGENSEEKIDNETIENIIETVDLLSDNEAGKIIQ